MVRKKETVINLSHDEIKGKIQEVYKGEPVSVLLEGELAGIFSNDENGLRFYRTFSGFDFTYDEYHIYEDKIVFIGNFSIL